ncbi:MAG: TldD/PmbA family protein [Armatimonadota bacterium]|nr:TldD/PmbA family protein [Armatimonadota bacterium]
MIAENAQLMGRGRITEILQSALERSEAEQTQVSLSLKRSGLTRFARSAIHQNVAERTACLAVKAVIGKRIGFALTSSLDERSVFAVVSEAVEVAQNQRDNPDFVSLPEPKPIGYYPETFHESTAAFGPEERAAAVGAVIAEADQREAEAAGSFMTVVGESAVANSLGVDAYVNHTSAFLSTVITAGSGFGAATGTAMDAASISPSRVGAEATDRAAASRGPIGIEPGEYDVVLLPYAVAELIEFLGILGLGALSVQEGRSFVCGKFGRRICSEAVTIWDDGLDPMGIVRPFDREGTPKQRVDLIVDGVAEAVVYDSHTAKKEGKESTGHATDLTGLYGPMPANLFLRPGTSSLEDMIASTKRGILVSRFHYVNVLHPIQTILTGMTRDGTFLIEDGRITSPVKNLRFTESILKALSNVELVGSDIRPVGLERTMPGVACAPSIKIRDFRFTGVTEF